MKSYTTLRNLYGSLTQNTLTDNLTFGDQIINDGIRKIIAMPKRWDFLDTTSTTVTVASQSNYKTPYNFDKLYTVTITVGTTKYTVKEAPNREYWDKLQESTNVTSDTPEWYFLDSGQINFYPAPASSGNTINFNYKQSVRDLSNADYTTGTVTATNASTTITGAGTTFTAAMVGRYLKVNADNFWYKIASFTNATTIVLDKAFQGTTVAGAAFTIGEMPILPESFHDLPVFYAVMMYYTYKITDFKKERDFAQLWVTGLKDLEAYAGNRSSGVLIEDDSMMQNPNLNVTL